MIALMGGTFDPVHIGHLRAATEVGEALACPVYLVPCHVPPHRHPPQAGAQDRLDMLECALRGQSQLRVSDIELRRPGPSYFVDTLAALRAQHGAQVPVIMILGADAFAGLARWHRWEALFELAHIGVVNRPGYGGVFDAEVASEWFARRIENFAQLRQKPAGCIVSLQITPLPVSATQIRGLVRERRSIRFLTPDPVVELIEGRGLYR